MRRFPAFAFAPLCLFLLLTSSSIAQDQSLSQKEDERLKLVLERIGERVEQYRENHTLLLKLGRSKLQYFKDDLTTPKDEVKESEWEHLVIHRPLPDEPTENGLFVIWKLIKAEPKEMKRWQQTSKEVKAYPFVTELDFLLRKEQAKYSFDYGGETTVLGRKAYVINFIPAQYEAPKFVKRDGRDYFTPAPRKGRIIVDADSHDVLQVDWTLIDKAQLHREFGFQRKGIFFMTRPDVDLKWEKWDTTLKFKQYSFNDKKEMVWLPESSETIWFVKGARKPVYKMSIAYDYKRFSTDVKILDDVKIVSDAENEEMMP